MLENRDYQAVAFSVPVAKFYTAEALGREKRIPAPGADLLSEDFDPTAAAVRMRACADEEDRECSASPVGDGGCGQRVQVGDLLCRRRESLLAWFVR